jgi:hypothetical protein
MPDEEIQGSNDIVYDKTEDSSHDTRASTLFNPPKAQVYCGSFETQYARTAESSI